MPQSAHDEIISALLNVLDPLKGEIRLLGRVSHSVIGNPSEKEAFLIIPDLHLLSTERRQHFKYGFNHGGLLAKLLEKITGLRKEWRKQDRDIVTLQIGDFFDAWREFPGSASPGNIPGDTWEDLRDLLYRGVDTGGPCLNAPMLWGNHDTIGGRPLKEIHPFVSKFFNRPEEKQEPFLFATHGDAFDIIETMVPQPIKAFAVNIMGALVTPKEYDLDEWSKKTAGMNKPIENLENAITEPEHSLKASDGAILVSPEAPLPELFCQEISSPKHTTNPYFEKFYESIGIVGEKGLTGRNVTVVAMGHTHQAALIFYRPHEGRPLVLMDVGAWIESCKYSLDKGGAVVTEPSAQLGVIHGNDARIYQIHLPQKG